MGKPENTVSTQSFHTPGQRGASKSRHSGINNTEEALLEKVTVVRCALGHLTAPERDVLFEPLHDIFSFKNMRTLVNLLGSYLDKKYQVWIRNIIHLF